MQRLIYCLFFTTEWFVFGLHAGRPPPPVYQWALRTVLYWDCRARWVGTSIVMLGKSEETQTATVKDFCAHKQKLKDMIFVAGGIWLLWEKQKVNFCPNRETNLKVRQALTVTSDLGDVSEMMDFDGEMMPSICLFSHLRYKSVKWDFSISRNYCRCVNLFFFSTPFFP